MKPVKIETLPPFDTYADQALFFADQTVEIVSYKFESEISFDSVLDFERWKARKYF